MPTREEIREGIAERIYRWYCRNSELNNLGEWCKVSGYMRGIILSITDMVMEYEDSQGVVIKVDRELPECGVELMKHLKEYGYVAVGSLIEVKDANS